MLLRDLVRLGDRLLLLLGVRLRVFEKVEEVVFVDVIVGNDENVNKRVDVIRYVNGKKLVVKDGLGDPVCDTLGDPVIDELEVILTFPKDDTVAKRLHVKSLSRFISNL